MRTCAEGRNALQDYEVPLTLLEEAFRAAGRHVKFVLFMAPLENKMVEITCRNERWKKLVCIEGASPAQAVKDVAAAVSI